MNLRVEGSRVTVLGHTQRGGSPSVYDRRMAFEFTTLAVDELLRGNQGFAVCSEGGQLKIRDLSSLPSKPTLDPELIKLVSRLCQ